MQWWIVDYDHGWSIRPVGLLPKRPEDAFYDNGDEYTPYYSEHEHLHLDVSGLIDSAHVRASNPKEAIVRAKELAFQFKHTQINCDGCRRKHEQ